MVVDGTHSWSRSHDCRQYPSRGRQQKSHPNSNSLDQEVHRDRHVSLADPIRWAAEVSTGKIPCSHCDNSSARSPYIQDASQLTIGSLVFVQCSINLLSAVAPPKRREFPSHVTLASLILCRGLARSSRNLALYSSIRRSLSSFIDCLCGRAGIMVRKLVRSPSATEFMCRTNKA